MAAASDDSDDSLPAPAIALAAWVFPGLGYWLLGEKKRAVIVCLCILALFIGGILIGGIRVVDAPDGISFNDLLAKPWFIGQIMAGPISLIAALASRGVDPLRISYGRSNEIATLYTALAGMLNLLVIIDAGHRSAAGPLEFEETHPDSTTDKSAGNTTAGDTALRENKA